MDAISRICTWYFDWASALPPIHFQFLVKAILFFAWPCLLCGWALASGNRTLPVQVLWASVGLLLAATISVDKLVITGRLTRGWILLCGAVVLAFTPGAIAAVIVPTIGMQRKVRIFGYATLVVLFLINLILARRGQ